ncbi:MAG: diaminopimelate decarboxylase [Proteobacteria bacterium]|nr:diaminopimelate decarboxylase [Pseudomonadota bacterium]
MAVDAFVRINGELHAEGVRLTEIAEAVGTPVFVYSRNHFVDRYQQMEQALNGLDHRICYAVKANSNLGVLRCFQELGAGFDIVSGGELQRVLAAGGAAENVVFSGVGKSEADIDFALKLGVGCFNVESASELERLIRRARLLGVVAAVSLRVNPNVDPGTHPYISTGLKQNKFGIPAAAARQVYRRAANAPELRIVGVDCHIGSQISRMEPYLDALDRLLELIDDLNEDGIEIEHIDLGGGMGVTYTDETPFNMAAYGAALSRRLGNRHETVVLEPGRFLVANGGILLTRVEYLKPGFDASYLNFAIVDAAMNDLIRPALYQAQHPVQSVLESQAEVQLWDIVGPVCESGDFLAKERSLALEENALLAIGAAGAYGMVQSSNYNSRGRAAEVLVDGKSFTVVRVRETVRDQLRLELPRE